MNTVTTTLAALAGLYGLLLLDTVLRSLVFSHVEREHAMRSLHARLESEVWQ